MRGGKARRARGAWSSITLCTDSHPLHVLDDLRARTRAQSINGSPCAAPITFIEVYRTGLRNLYTGGG